MNREMRRIQEREERLQKKQDPDKDKGTSRRAAALQSKPQRRAQVVLPAPRGLSA